MNRRPTALSQALHAEQIAHLEWLKACHAATVAHVETLSAKLKVITTARDAGLTWPQVAEAIDYNRDDPDSYDAVKAGKALHRWYNDQQDNIAELAAELEDFDDMFEAQLDEMRGAALAVDHGA